MFISTALQGFLYDPHVEAGMGWRRDDLEWSIGGDAPMPKTLSELKWKNVQSLDFTAEAHMALLCYYVEASGNLGLIFSGKNTDTDFFAPGDVMRSKSSANRGQVWDVSGGFGFYPGASIGAFHYITLAGWAWHGQNLHMKEGTVVMVQNQPMDVDIEGLDSRYFARWEGPWLGIAMGCWVSEDTDLRFRFEYHNVDYRAEGHWNLRQDLVRPFKHKAHGYGFKGTLGFRTLFCDCLEAGLDFNGSLFRTRKGVDKVYVLIDGVEYTWEARLNKVEWASASLIATLGLQF